MSCKRFGPAIAAHAAGGAIDPAAERHLGECAACRRRLDTHLQLLAELDRELGRTLSISAAPDFAARVARQARHAGEAKAQRWIPAPVWAGLGATAVIMLSVWIPRAPVRDPETIRAKTEAARPRTEDVLLRAEATEVQKAAPAGARLAATRRSAAHSPDRRRIASREPAVIVEPSRALAIQRLRELMAEGRLDGDMLPPPRTPEASLAELIVAPLTISEIKVPDVEIVSRPPAASPERQ